MARKKEDETAKSIDLILLRREARIDGLGELLELEARIGLPQPVVEHGQHSMFSLVMLVLDFADDFLDDIFDRDEALGSAEFIDDNRKMDVFTPHSSEKLDDPHRFRNEQRLAHQSGDRSVARRIDIGDEHVLDVNHAD